MATVFMILLGFAALFLILLILVQRGRGGGLAGALGGMGGSSAFGAKAGDVFTKITIGAATVWIVLCIIASKMISSGESKIDIDVNAPATSAIQAAPETDSEAATPAAEAAAETTEEATAEEASTDEAAAEPAADESADSEDK